MTVIEIIDIFTFYGVDVIILAAVTAALVQACKLLFMKNVQKKFFTLMPFAVGLLLYACYAAARNLSFRYLIDNVAQVLEYGLSVGTVATLLYVIYEQFVRGNTAPTKADVVCALLDGYVAADRAAEAAKLIVDASENAERTAEILTEFAEEGVTEGEIASLAELINQTLCHLKV